MTDTVSHMERVPLALSRVLRATDESDSDQAWADFLATHSRILLHTCRMLTRNRDAAMDGYAFVLEALRENGCRRLRAYAPNSTTQFTTWLVVVARRLLLDRHRQRYGRPRGEDEARREEHAVRRRLEDLVATEIDPEELSAPGTETPDAAIRQGELRAALRSAIDALDANDRLLLALRFEDDLPVREIATTLRLPTVFHVYRRLGVVLAALRRALAERGVDTAIP